MGRYKYLTSIEKGAGIAGALIVWWFLFFQLITNTGSSDNATVYVLGGIVFDTLAVVVIGGVLSWIAAGDIRRRRTTTD